MGDATRSLAAEIEAVCDRLDHLNTVSEPQACADTMDEARLLIRRLSAEIAALQSRGFEDGAPKHVVEALRREAQQQAFMRELAEQTYRRMREKFLRAAHRALDGGDDRALHRFVHTLESAVPIQGSSALPLQPEGEQNA